MSHVERTKIVFLDRDGTLITEPADKQNDSLEKLELEPGVIPALLALQAQGYRLVMVSNQDGLGTVSFPLEAFEKVQQKLLQMFASQNILFDAIHLCPHWEADFCECRKPRLGMVLDYLADPNWDRERSYVIGDRSTDCELAKRMRVQGILYSRGTNNWSTIVSRIQNTGRTASLERQTTETRVLASVDLDKSGERSIQTGLGFFDHMLDQFAKHAGIGLQITSCGDLQVDEHHLVEDTALVLGRVLHKALGDKRGIGRYGFVLPMDEALAEVALDLSGRSFFQFDGVLTRERVGDFPTEMVEHFFRSWADGLQATLHMKVRGGNDHHQIESLFKGLGRAFRQAKSLEGLDLPSTKGVL